MAIYSLSSRRGRARSYVDDAPVDGPPGAALRAEFLLLATLDIAVEGLRARPASARFDLGGEVVEHRAAFEVLREDGTSLVDVALVEDLHDHPLRVALICGSVEAEDGRRFRLETPETLRAEPRLSSLRLVMACRGTPVSPGDRINVLYHLGEAGTSTLVEAAASARHAPDGVAAVLALAADGPRGARPRRPHPARDAGAPPRAVRG
jgi:hypothetical protein